MPTDIPLPPEAGQPSMSTARCDSYAYTRRRGGCGAPATKLLTVTFTERRTRRYRLCDRHASGVHEDAADPLFAYLGCTGVREAPITPAGNATSTAP